MFHCRNCACRKCSTVYESLPDRLLGRGGQFTYVKCRQCGLVQLSPVPADLAAYYTNYRLHNSDSPVYRLLRKLLVGHCYLVPNTSTGMLLDVGCGNGWYMLALAERGWDVCGYELDADYAAKLSIELDEEVVANAEALAERTGRFDLATFNFSFEHLTEPRKFLELAHRCLRTGGTIRLSLPNIEGVEARFFGRDWFAVDPPRHITFFTKGQICRLLGEMGFGDFKVKNLPVPTGLAGSLCYRLCGSFNPLIWYASVLPGVVWSLFVPDGLFAVSAKKK